MASVMTYQKNAYYSETSYGRAPLAFIGWFSEPTLKIQIDHKPANGEEMSMVYAHLPIPTDAPNSVRAAFNPFESKPILALEDNKNRRN